MIRGDVVFVSHLNVSLGPKQWASYKAPTGHLMVLVALGNMMKKDGSSFDVEGAMRSLGWVRAEQANGVNQPEEANK